MYIKLIILLKDGASSCYCTYGSYMYVLGILRLHKIIRFLKDTVLPKTK